MNTDVGKALFGAERARFASSYLCVSVSISG
jgi:hypothetical protein